MIEYIIDIIIIMNILVLYEPMKAVVAIVSENKKIDMSKYDYNIYAALAISSPLIFIK